MEERPTMTRIQWQVMHDKAAKRFDVADDKQAEAYQVHTAEAEALPSFKAMKDAEAEALAAINDLTRIEDMGQKLGFIELAVIE